jgi:transcription elongation factor SPT6
MLVGIVLEDNITLADGFQYNSPRKVAGLNDDEEKDDDFRIWKSPVINDLGPMRFANELVGSGELVLVSNSTDDGPNSGMKDPLKGCRHVAAMELSSETRIRRYLRNIYRKNALLTTYPTPKGLHDVDAFSEFYGLHLIRNKPLKEHFPADEKDHEEKYFGLSLEERKELDEEANNRERESCVQYLRILKGERAKVLFIKIHLPFINDDYGEEWYRQENMSRQEMDFSTLLNPLKNIYIPSDDTVDWCEKRNKILDLTLKGFLLPQFETEARHDLQDAAHKFGVESAALSLQSMAMEGPYRPTHLIKENRFLIRHECPIVVNL